MALNKNATQQQAPAFEPLDDDEVGSAAETQTTVDPRLAAAAAARAEQAAKAEQKPASTALAKPAGGQVQVAKAMINPLEPLKNAFHVEYDTLRNLQINQGNVIDKDSGKPLGDTIGLELLSYQDQYVVSPGVDGDEAKEFVRYSDDGITTTQGENCQEYLASLKAANFPEAKISQRMVICGSVFDSGKLKDLKDSLVQISLPPTSKAAFNRYMLDQAFKIGKKLIEPEGANRVKIECTLTTKGSNTWTVADFTRYDA